MDPFIEAEEAAGHSVKHCCELFEVSRAAYYERRRGVLSAKEVSDAELAEKITAIHTTSKGTYGSRAGPSSTLTARATEGRATKVVGEVSSDPDLETEGKLDGVEADLKRDVAKAEDSQGVRMDGWPPPAGERRIRPSPQGESER